MEPNGNRDLKAVAVLVRLKNERPDVHKAAYVVGRWVWVHFDAMPAPEIRDYLKALGFHWNRMRNAWQHTGGIPCHHSPGDPRDRYGYVPASELNLEALQAAS